MADYSVCCVVCFRSEHLKDIPCQHIICVSCLRERMLYHDTHIRCPVCQQIHMVPGVDVESFLGCKEESTPWYFATTKVHGKSSRNVQISRDEVTRKENFSTDTMGTSVDSITQAINETIYKLSGKKPTKRNVREVHNKGLLRSQTTQCEVHRPNNIQTVRQNAPLDHHGVHLKKEISRKDRICQSNCTYGIDRSSSGLGRSKERIARTSKQHQGDTVVTARKDVRFSGKNAETDSSQVHSGNRSTENMQNIMKTKRVKKEISSRHSCTRKTDRGREKRSEPCDNITKQNQHQEGAQGVRNPRNKHNAGNNPDEPQRVRTRSRNNKGNAVVAHRETSCGPGHHETPNVPTDDESFASENSCCDILCCICHRCTSNEQYVRI